MTKKQYLLKLLTALQDERPVANGLRILVEQEQMDDTMVDHMAQIFEGMIAQHHNRLAREKLQNAIDKAKKLRERN
jgi:hypothetical protein